jgi:hypothetical protein
MLSPMRGAFLGRVGVILGISAHCLACSASDGSGSDASGGAGAVGNGGTSGTGATGGVAIGGSSGQGTGGAVNVGGAGGTASCVPSTNGTLGVDCASVGIQLVAPYDQSYTCLDLGQDLNIPPKWGGLTTASDDPNVLLIGGSANTDLGQLYRRGIIRDAACHIVGFSNDAASVYSEGAYNDGGVLYGPGGVMWLARWPVNQLGFMKPGSLITDKIIDTSLLGVAYSLAALNFIPNGFDGAGGLRLVSWPEGQWYSADYTPDATGTFDISNVQQPTTIVGGPEGFVYIAAGNAQFPKNSMLVSEWSANNIAAYEVDTGGNPVPATRKDFVLGLTGAEGAFLDPLSGDFLFSTFAEVNRVIAIRGFKPPPDIPR